MEVFFKQRDDLFFPSWSFVVPTTIMRLPVSFVESLIWTAITYYPVGLAPQASRYALLPPIISLERSSTGCDICTPCCAGSKQVTAQMGPALLSSAASAGSVIVTDRLKLFAAVSLGFHTVQC